MKTGLCDTCGFKRRLVPVVGMHAFGKPVVDKNVCRSCSKLWLNIFELAAEPMGQMLLMVNTKLDLLLGKR